MKTPRVAMFLCFGGILTWSSTQLGTYRKHASFHELFDSAVTESELRMVASFVVLVLSVVILNELVRVRVKTGDKCRSPELPYWRRICAWMTGILLVNTSTTIPTSSPDSKSVGVPLGSVLSPAAASAVVAQILRRRREQMAQRFMPDIFSDDEQTALRRIEEMVPSDAPMLDDDVVVPATLDVVTVMSAVNREVQESSDNASYAEIGDWLIEVKLFGYPMVVAANGGIAEFRKKRSLELLTWLALNRNRGRRSAARTALWDIEVSDSTFSTVVSDLRRSLREVVGYSHEIDFIPTTYSDALPLSDRVTTDADRLRHEFAKFQESDGHMTDELRLLLRGIRDVPFSGTSYSWADLDGTTTRLVITALNACTDIAEVLGRNGNWDDMNIAIEAGLRVLPGCEELLAVQQSYLKDAFTQRSVHTTFVPSRG